ncbi:MAG TPA: glycogen/starch synthase [Actinocrinis sp.]|uniref:glycogen synthase n=1 Tax=Actinocrinis sp. TaxID=1920516 RepID=UPI002DDCDB65|nr:glycogen/starch synthase [Actinocrinis sp.]HEV3171105.1 glycogen/starch synthase [Actinocrinis sp.]
MKCLYITQEYAPHFVEGGLGLASRAMPAALQTRHGMTHDLVLPAYPWLLARSGLRTAEICRLPGRSVGGVTSAATVLRLLDHGGPCEVILIRADAWYDRDGIYRDAMYAEFADAVERSAFFGACVADWIEQTGAAYELVHANDWQSGAALAHVRSRRTGSAPALLMNIHSAVYEGRLPLPAPQADTADGLGLPEKAVARLRNRAPGGESMLALGLLSADAAVTCSPSYAREIPAIHAKSPVADLWADMDHTGIVSGVDDTVWNPAIPGRPSAPFDADTVDEGKRLNKSALQRRLGLGQNPEAPVVGVCSRFVDEKGTDLLLAALVPLLAEESAQVVLMGPGEEPFRAELAHLADRHPHRLAYLPQFDQELAWLVYAGSDLTVMPSRVEPCGLNQLIAMAYGTLPVVCPVGGLRDTVVSADRGDGTGWIIPAHTSQAVLETVRSALSLLRHQPAEATAMRRRAMAQDWSWTRTADEFARLYLRLTARPDVPVSASRQERI